MGEMGWGSRLCSFAVATSVSSAGKEKWTCDQKEVDPIVSHIVFALLQCSTTLTPHHRAPPGWGLGLNPCSRPWKRWHIDYPDGEKTKLLSLMRKSTPCEEEAFINLFCLFSITNRGQDYAAALIALCLLHLNFKLRGSLFPLLWSFQSLPLAIQAPQQNSDYWDF